MDGTIQILGIAGSLRDESYNSALLHAATELVPEGTRIRTFERLEEIPPFNEDVEAQGDPEPVRELKEALEQADAFLIVTPEYNYSVPGVLKNALDWASRPADSTPLADKPTGIMGASVASAGSARAQLALRDSLVFTRTPVLAGPEVLVSNAAERFDDEGRLTHEPTREFVAQYLERLVEFARKQAPRARHADESRD